MTRRPPIHPDWEALVRQLRARREELGITRVQIADELGYLTGDKAVYDWEALRRQPPNYVLHRWVELLGGRLTLDFAVKFEDLDEVT